MRWDVSVGLLDVLGQPREGGGSKVPIRAIVHIPGRVGEYKRAVMRNAMYSLIIPQC